MSETRPAPMVPAEVDLRDFAFMPLDVLRLRDSDLSCVEDAEVFRCAVLSWCVAWHQTPAASLPDDDTLLSRLLGFGRDVKGWKRIRAAGGLRGWIECDDGRLYHPVVAEKARDAWRGKLEQRWRTEAARVKKHNQRHRLDGESAVVMPEFDEWMSLGCPWGQSLPVPGTRGECPERQLPPVPRETASKGQGEGQGQGQGEEREKTAASPRSPAPSAGPPPDPADTIFGLGLPLLTTANVSDRNARSMLGLMRKTHGDEAVIGALQRCATEKPLQPVAWLQAALKAAPPAGAIPKPDRIAMANIATVQRFAERTER